MKAENTLIFFFFIWLIVSIFFGEQIPAGNGLGWDGILYSNITQHFSTSVFGNQLSEYYVQRILPSGIIFYTAKLMHAPLTDQNMPMAFGIYNTIILCAGVYLWKLIATQQKWSLQVRLISFSGLFLNYAVLKMNTYYTVLTDISAFTCSLLMLYFYVCNKNYRVLFSGILGAFIFPTLLYVSIIMFIFPRNMDGNEKINIEAASRGNQWLSFAVAAFILALALLFKLMISKLEWATGHYSWTPVLCLSALALFGYLLLGFRPMMSNYIPLIYKLRRAFHFQALFAVIAFIAVNLILNFLSSNEPGPLTLTIFLEVLLVRSLAYPLIFLISHTLYYGPIICLLLCFWKETVNYLKNNGYALLIVFFFYVILSINSESRQIINFLPIAVFAISEILNQKIIPRHFGTIFVLLSLLISRFWLPLNHSEWLSLDTNPIQLTLEFPMQWYFMSQGPWMSPIMYLIGSAVVSALFYYIYKLSKQPRQSNSK